MRVWVDLTNAAHVIVLRPLVDSPDERRRVGAASRAYVEEVHDVRRMADRLLDLYAGLGR